MLLTFCISVWNINLATVSLANRTNTQRTLAERTLVQRTPFLSEIEIHNNQRNPKNNDRDHLLSSYCNWAINSTRNSRHGTSRLNSALLNQLPMHLSNNASNDFSKGPIGSFAFSVTYGGRWGWRCAAGGSAAFRRRKFWWRMERLRPAQTNPTSHPPLHHQTNLLSMSDGSTWSPAGS